MKQANEIADKTLNLLQLKLNEIKFTFKSGLTYPEIKGLDRLRVAIEKSMEAVRRAKLDNGIPEILRR